LAWTTEDVLPAVRVRAAENVALIFVRPAQHLVLFQLVVWAAENVALILFCLGRGVPWLSGGARFAGVRCHHDHPSLSVSPAISGCGPHRWPTSAIHVKSLAMTPARHIVKLDNFLEPSRVSSQ
jgi:hypothetical protein